MGEGQTTSENRSKNTERFSKFVNTAEKIEAFNGQKLETIFSDENSKREFLTNLSENDFSQLISGLNGILRGKKREDWTMDGKTVYIKSGIMGPEYTPPLQEDKPQLFNEVLSATKKMNAEGKDLKDIALLISSSINAIHAFSDANGRTSRTIYTLLTQDYNNETKQNLQNVLSDDGRIYTDINPGLIQIELEDLIKNEIDQNYSQKNPNTIAGFWAENGTPLHEYTLKNFEFKSDIKEEQKNKFLFLINLDEEFVCIATNKLIQNKPDKENYIKHFPYFSRILIDKLFKNLNSADLDNLLTSYRKIKIDFVKKLIDCIANPNKKGYEVAAIHGSDSKTQKLPLKTHFEDRIKFDWLYKNILKDL